MRFLLACFTLILSMTAFNQDGTVLENPKEIKPLAQKEITYLAENISGVEITFFEGSSSVSMQGNKNASFLPAAIDTISPDSLNTKNHAYVMIMVNDDFYMDAQLSWVKENAYLAINKDGITYYNRLTEQGIKMFTQLMQ